MTPTHSNARDVALRRLSRANRWMIAGSVGLTAVFSEVAASAFPGRTAKAAGGTGSHSDKSSGPANALKAPSEAPKASTTPEVSPSQEAPPAQESSHESSPESSGPSPSREATPAQEAAPSHESAPAEERAPVKESAPAPAPEPAPAPAHESAPPVVSGGS